MAVVSAAYLQLQRGRKLFLDGKRCPPKPDDNCTGLEPHSLLWIGYRVAKALDWMKRRDVAEQLNMPEPDWVE